MLVLGATASTASLKLQRLDSIACNWKNPAAALVAAIAGCNLAVKKKSSRSMLPWLLFVSATVTREKFV
jgi:hypothetical protein